MTAAPGRLHRLEVRKVVRASPERLFSAWTSPDQLRLWWGPVGATCPSAEVDLRVGGRYRIENRFPDGRTIWIVGEFEVVAPPHELVYTWRLDPGPARTERVTVRFEPREDGTQVVVVHERIPDPAAREQHAQGWQACLDGLADYLGRAGAEAVASGRDWRPLVERGAPGPDEVRIVRLRLDRPYEPDHFEMLSASERERAARFVFEIHRRRFVAARASLRRVLGLCLDRDPAGLVFGYTDRGRPSLRLSSHPDFDFNLAHCGDVALLAFSSRKVGVDVERLRDMPNALAVARRFFSPREVAALRRLAEGARRQGFFNAWTRKEALIKAVGTGLAALKETEVSLAPDEIPAVLRAPGGAEAWQLFHLEPVPAFVGAVAVPAGPPPVRLTTWSWP